MVKGRVFISLSLALAALPPAWAKSNWIRFFTVSNNAVMSVDAESMKLSPNGKVWTTWIKTDFSAVKATTLKSGMQQVSIDCENETYWLGDGQIYYRDGTNTNTKKQLSRAIMPDTPPAELFDILCKEAPEQASKREMP